MMERVKGMIAGFGILALALGTKTIVSEVNIVAAMVTSVIILLILPPVIAYGEKILKKSFLQSPHT